MTTSLDAAARPIAARTGIAPAAVLTAAVHVLLYRYTGSSRPVAGPAGTEVLPLEDGHTFGDVVNLRPTATDAPPEACLRIDSAGNSAVTGTVPGMEGHLRTLLDAAYDSPSVPISLLPLLTEAERRTMIMDWNADTAVLAGPSCLPDLFAAQVRRTPETTAVVCGSVRMTYAELDVRANRLAHLLRGKGVAPEMSVGVCLERSEMTVVAFLAVMKAGGVFVPLDPDYPDERIGVMLAEASVGVLITDSDLVPTLPVEKEACVLLDAAGLDAWPATPPPVSLTLEDLCALVFTSGSTGTPKCAMLTHGNLANYVGFWKACELDRRPMRVHLQMTSFAFVIFLADLTRALFTGATLVVVPREIVLSPGDLYELMIREGVNSAEFVPPVLKMLLDAAESDSRGLEFLDLLVAGGDVWPTVDYLRARRLCGPATRMISAYGMTETAIDSTWLADGEIDETAAVVPIGRPTPNTRAYVLDRHMQPLPSGVVGELYIGGLGVCRGYLGQAALTAERFVPDHLSGVPGGRLYRTGDLARWRADGVLEIFGRVDQQVKINGIRVELGEIEAVLRRHPRIRDAAVIAEGTALEERRLVAFIAVTGTVEGLEAYLRERLPETLVPSVVTQVAELPLNEHGKIARRGLGAGPTAPADDPAARMLVVVNAVGQYALWPARANVPAGWRVRGAPRSREEALRAVDALWTGPRPRSA
ncbi:amino acid adenylation domain-containing protein [Actinomadura monticuli]|uniref:Amino acid adenylation domain-containing protein n=1 Tax=Actinomadura monticuli TaxID=3097367 RepID=A0ABV4Q4J9_9ACTN